MQKLFFTVLLVCRRSGHNPPLPAKEAETAAQTAVEEISVKEEVAVSCRRPGGAVGRI